MDKFHYKQLQAICIIVISGLPVLTIAQNNWIKLESGVKNRLTSVDFISTDTGWVVTDDNIILKTTDGGINWIFQKAMTSDHLKFVKFLSPNRGYVLGTKFLDWGHHMTIECTMDGGENWSLSYWGGLGGLASIDFISSFQGWAVGYELSLIVPPWGYTLILQTLDGGMNWHEIYREENGPVLHSVDFISYSTGWAAGNNGVIYSTPHGGIPWFLQKSGTSCDLNSINFVSQDKGWVVGDSGTILYTEDGGLNWLAQQSGTDIDLNQIVFVSATEGWIVGNKGTILHTKDGGLNWLPQESGVKIDLYSVDFVTSQTGWAVGDSGIILKYSYPDYVAVDTIGRNEPEKAIQIQDHYVLRQNYPNPFNPITTISYALPKPGQVRMQIFDINGREVKSLVNGFKEAGVHSIKWNAKDKMDNRVASGIYICRMTAGNVILHQKLILAK